MSSPYSFIGSGYYTSDTTAQNIALSDRPDFFRVVDTTLWGANDATNYTAAANIESSWNRSMAQGSYLQVGQSAALLGVAAMYPTRGTSGGFTFVDQTNPPNYSKIAVTGINATTWVVSTGTTTGLAIGDYVRLINMTSMQQFSGYALYQITAISAGVNFTLGYAATAKTAGMPAAANGTTGFYQKVYPSYWYPHLKSVAYVTQATQAKVYFFGKNDFTAGEMVDFQVPTTYGMIQLSNLTGQSRGPARVLSVTNSASESSITLDLDTSGFTAFTIPATAAFAGGASPATCFPAGSGVVPLNGSATIPQSPPGTNLVDAFDNKNQYVMNVGTSVVGANSSVIFWEAWKGDYFNGISNA